MLVLCAPACVSSRQAACPETSVGSERAAPRGAARAPVAAPTPAPGALTEDAAGVAGTWLWSCCDGSETWIGMLVLVEAGATLRGSILADGDSHGSYVEGKTDGDRVQFSRRWYTAGVLHEQFYELVHDARAHRLVGTFTEPGYEAKAHEIRIERGFTPVPRLLRRHSAGPRTHGRDHALRGPVSVSALPAAAVRLAAAGLLVQSFWQ